MKTSNQGIVKAGVYLVNSLDQLVPYRTSQSGATDFPFPDRAEAERLAQHLGYSIVELRADSIGF